METHSLAVMNTIRPSYKMCANTYIAAVHVVWHCLWMVPIILGKNNDSHVQAFYEDTRIKDCVQQHHFVQLRISDERKIWWISPHKDSQCSYFSVVCYQNPNTQVQGGHEATNVNERVGSTISVGLVRNARFEEYHHTKSTNIRVSHRFGSYVHCVISKIS